MKKLLTAFAWRPARPAATLLFLLLLCSPRPARGESGILDIESDPPGAQVYLNNKKVGTTPYYDPYIPVGAYTLRVSLPDYRDYAESIILNNFDEVKRRIVFKKKRSSEFGGQFEEYQVETDTGNVVIASVPKGATIFINGVQVERSAPFSRKDVEVGHYTVTARSGQKELSSLMDVIKGKTTKLVFDFGRGRTVSELADAAVDIDLQAAPLVAPSTVPPPSPAKSAVKQAQEATAARRKAEAEERAARQQAEAKTAAEAKAAVEAKAAEEARAAEEAAKAAEEAALRKTREKARQAARELEQREIERARQQAERLRIEQEERSRIAQERAKRLEVERARREAEEAARIAEEQRRRLTPSFVLIPGGEFPMGFTGKASANPEVRTVKVKAFYLAEREVTQSQWKAIMNTTPWKGYRKDGDDLPATNLFSLQDEDRWAQVKEFLRRISEASGKKMRLPTEAEWEFAAGNGATHTRYSWGDTILPGHRGGNVADECLRRDSYLVNADQDRFFLGYDDGFSLLSPAGTFEPNTFGLYDMTGNVWELVSKGGNPDGDLVMKGGSNNTGPAESPVTSRSVSAHPMEVGLRLARDAD